MPNEEEIKNKEVESQQKKVDDSVDYIEAIKEIKENSVDKSLYEELREKNKQLIKALATGQTLEGEKEEAVDIKKLRAELYSEDSDLSNLEYAKKTLELRDALIAEGGRDPFLPWGEKIIPTQQDVEAANRVYEVMKECIEYADGDNAVFTNELQRRTIDVTLPKRRN